MKQRGFATLEVILMIVVIGILAAIAMPRFNSITISANTAKIQADLSTIDSAIAIYYMEKGNYPNSFPDDLKDYLRDAENIKPPKGKAYIKGDNGTVSEMDPGASNYSFKTVNSETRAVLNGHTSGDFTTQK